MHKIFTRTHSVFQLLEKKLKNYVKLKTTKFMIKNCNMLGIFTRVNFLYLHGVKNT